MALHRPDSGPDPLSLLGAATPALKKTMLDLVSSYGTTSPETSEVGGSYQLRYLRSRPGGQGLTNNRKTRSLPFSGTGKGGSVAMVSSRARKEEKIRSDGDSQDGIIRQCVDQSAVLREIPCINAC